jgi:hypothetical protein
VEEAQIGTNGYVSNHTRQHAVEMGDEGWHQASFQAEGC